MIGYDSRWDFEEDKPETKKMSDAGTQEQTLSKKDLYEQRYGKKSITTQDKKEDKEDDIDFSKLNSLDES